MRGEQPHRQGQQVRPEQDCSFALTGVSGGCSAWHVGQDDWIASTMILALSVCAYTCVLAQGPVNDMRFKNTVLSDGFQSTWDR